MATLHHQGFDEFEYVPGERKKKERGLRERGTRGMSFNYVYSYHSLNIMCQEPEPWLHFLKKDTHTWKFGV